MIRPIGAGQFGVVFEVEHRIPGLDTPQIRAVKALRQGSSKLSMIDFVREAEILSELKHNNIVRLEGVCLQQQPWLLVEELVPYGDLDYVLRVGQQRRVHIKLPEILAFSLQVRCPRPAAAAAAAAASLTQTLFLRTPSSLIPLFTPLPHTHMHTHTHTRAHVHTPLPPRPTWCRSWPA